VASSSHARRSVSTSQRVLVFRSWGGARRGAGRKPNGLRAGVAHTTRAILAERHPVHITSRLRAGLPSLRRDDERRVLERALAAGAERFGFRLVHHSIQSNHVHLLAEARDRRALWRGMQGLHVRVARALNRLWSRRGTVFADRYHARALRTPREVRAALVYVLNNARKHGIHLASTDPFSSGPWFDGWRTRVRGTRRARPGVAPRSWLLRAGWRRRGLLDVRESPRRKPP
jgi:REP element-mobilizing transposase RayT